MGERDQPDRRLHQEQERGVADPQRPGHQATKRDDVWDEPDLREGFAGTGDQPSETDEQERAPQPGLTPSP
jgi:hypothetical protein